MRRFIDEDAPTTEWPGSERVHSETPLGGVELAVLQSKNSAAWDAQTFAVRLPPKQEGPSRALAMAIAAFLSFAIGLGTFMLVMRLQAQSRGDAQVSQPATQTLGAAPLVQEGIPIPTPIFEVATPPPGVDIRFVPTGDVLAPPDPRLPAEVTKTVPPAATPPTVRKGKKQH